MIQDAGYELDAGELERSFGGELIRPHHPGYDAARGVHNAMFDRRPVLIARCHGVADVQAALRFARDHDLPIAVRGGGHAISGHPGCDDGIVIDLGPMKGVRVDASARTAGPGPASPGARSTARPRRSGWRRPAGGSRRRASPA